MLRWPVGRAIVAGLLAAIVLGLVGIWLCRSPSPRPRPGGRLEGSTGKGSPTAQEARSKRPPSRSVPPALGPLPAPPHASRSPALTGWVLLQDRSPAAGAELRLVPEWTVGLLRKEERIRPHQLMEKAASATVPAGPDGRFRIDELEAGTYHGLVRGPGIRPLVIHGLQPGSHDVEIQVEPGWDISGRLVNVRKEPLPGISLVLMDPEAPPREALAALRTDPAGRFSAEGLRPAPHILRVLPYQGYPGREEVVAPPEVALEIVLEAAPSILTVTAVEEGSSAAVAGAEVRLDIKEERAPFGTLEGRTDQLGRFGFHGRERGSGTLRVRSEWHLPAEPREVSFDPDAPPTQVVIELRRAGALDGVVKAPDGKPAAGARVFLAPPRPDRLIPGPEDPVADSTAAADGSFRLSLAGAAEGGPKAAMAVHPEFLPSEPIAIRRADAARDVRGIELTLRAAARLRGTVIGGDGLVPGAEIELYRSFRIPGIPATAAGEVSEGPARIFHSRTIADQHGRFGISGLEGGPYHLRTLAPGFAPARSDLLDLAEGETKDVNVELEPELTVGGRVATPDGAPVPEARLEAVPERGAPEDRRQTHSGHDGRYRLRGLEGGTYRIQARAAGFATAAVEPVAVGEGHEGDVDLILEPLAVIHGTVGSVAPGEAAPSFEVDLIPDDASLRPLDPPLRLAAPEGEFSFRTAPGRYRLVVKAPGFIPHESAVTIAPGLGTESRVELDPGERLTGTVRGADGAPIAGAKVFALREKRDAPPPSPTAFDPWSLARAPRGLTDSDGTFRIGGLEAGAFRVIARHEGHMTGMSEVVTIGGGQAGAPPALDLVLEPR